MTNPHKRYLSRRRQAERYDVAVRTIERWERDPELGYPPGVLINGRWYRDESLLETWERKRAGTAGKRGVEQQSDEIG
jgi:hypothetical protein